jgi:hypothetical protein
MNILDPIRLTLGLLGCLMAFYILPLSPAFLIVGWSNNFEWITKQRKQAVFSLFLIGMFFTLMLYRLRYPDPRLSFWDYPIKVATNPLLFAVSLLAFGSTVLLPLTTNRRWIIFGRMNWLALAILVIILLWALFMDTEPASPFRSAFNPLLSLLINCAFTFWSLLGAKRSRETRPFLIGGTILSVSLVGMIVWNSVLFFYMALVGLGTR